MTVHACDAPIGPGELIDYATGELHDEQQDAIEEHLFACDRCSRTLESIVSLGAAIAACVAGGQTAAAVTNAAVARADARGNRVRQYRVAPGQTVACTAGPDDTFVAIRLAGLLEHLTALDIDIDVHDLGTGERRTRHIEDVPVDVSSREIVLLFPGGMVRAYPRSRWTLEARGTRGGELVRLGPYTLDHTPWEQLTSH